MSPKKTEQHELTKLLKELSGCVDTFLVNWTRSMKQAGYLEHTTAKVDDCALSFGWFMEPLHKNAHNLLEKSFSELLLDRNWAKKIVDTSRRHRVRGVTAEMFLGCFKTLVHSIEEMILESPARAQTRIKALQAVRIYADALETIIMGDWTSVSEQESRDNLEKTNRILTLEKNKFENILASISDLVIVIDQQGRVVEVNNAASEFLNPSLNVGSFVWDILDLEGESMAQVLRYYPLDHAHEISIGNIDLFFELKIIPLSEVSLASRGYILVLNNITPHVKQRSILEENVKKSTEELRREKAQVEEMVITLKNVMNTMEESRKEHLSKISANIDKILLPSLARIRNEQNAPVRESYIDLFEDQLFKLAEQTGRKSDPRLLKLTPAEMRICKFIQAGKSSKEIAEALNISVGTVNTHRKNIRKKIGLHGKNSNLFTYLQFSGHAPGPEDALNG
ncbi:LuxR C-terminal-related transcriptional regulator [Desulfonatronovibrio hydrogenovorans]|uniref:LuxR C-terminal-related transcriptional regulator n=1 Tax=Desulfonatronovibrio hydrogenovorans TaxID=53245 RepID=UPI0006904B43|nr:LuxR C-terminal-related transcriptional regulator [Desulfonatronovibrio hydrogenovorans]